MSAQIYKDCFSLKWETVCMETGLNSFLIMSPVLENTSE